MGSSRTIGLSLSGGGFRASLFHLGVLKRLHELRILDQVNYISCVSGGAVVGALYVYLKKTRGAQFQFADLERALLSFVKQNPRTRWLFATIIRRVLLWIIRPPISLLFGQALRRISFAPYFNNLFSDQNLNSLLPATDGNGHADCPRLIINTTSLEIGQDYYFTPSYIGPRKEGALGIGSASPSRIGPDQVTIGTAVGASACFPVVLPPYDIFVNPNEADDQTPVTNLRLSRTRLVDGGVYDNQGFGVFMTEAYEPKERVDYLIASDASKTLQPTSSPLPGYFNVFRRLALLQRSHGITEDRARWERFGLVLYKRRTEDLAQIAIFHTDAKRLEAEPYTLPRSVTYRLARLRTDFDSFSDLEIVALMYHGYTLVNHRIFNCCYDLLPPALTSLNSTLFPDLRGKPLSEVRNKKSVTWSDVVKAIPNVMSMIEPLKKWNEFAAQMQASFPQRWRITRKLLGWFEQQWRPYLQEENPSVARDPSARVAVEDHLLYGATTSFLWRGLRRLEARGSGWRMVVWGLKLLFVLGILVAVEELLEFVAIPTAQLLVRALHFLLGWMHLLVG